MGDKNESRAPRKPRVTRKRRSARARRWHLERRMISYALTAGAATVAAGHEIK